MYSWMPIMGKMKEEGNKIIFKGEEQFIDTKKTGTTGLFICDKIFTGGTISADIKFTGVCELSCCDIVLYYDPQHRYTLNAGFSSSNWYSIRHRDGNGWRAHAFAGEDKVIEPNKVYRLKANMRGSLVSLFINNVEVIKANIPFALPQSQVGIFASNQDDIIIENYTITNEKAKVFVVTEFSSPSNEVYSEVIKNICNEKELSVLRIDEKSGPGLIISDINKAILDAKIIIADISSKNPNVFYEIGYAHAFNKPTILLAEKDTKLPFDISPFRTLFYEDSIVGKRKLEEGLRKHIDASLSERRS